MNYRVHFMQNDMEHHAQNYESITEAVDDIEDWLWGQHTVEIEPLPSEED